jgi:hypothetical protein
MQILLVAAMVLFILVACSREDVAPSTTTTTATTSATTTAPATATTPATAAQPPAQTTPSPAAADDDATAGTWAGQIKIDAHAGTGTLNYVGAESGDFVPMRFRTNSEVGTKILAQCADDDLCEIEGSVKFLDEAPPENASAVGEIVSVKSVKKLPPDAM